MVDSMPESSLRQPPPSSTSDPPAARSRENRNLETALYHANLLEQRKQVEAQILESLESLLDVPSSPNANPAHPSHQDATFVKNSLRPFQRSDYDDLIQERNINKQCGYVLCPRPNRLQDTKANYRILPGKGKGPNALKIVERRMLEMWCSDDCGKRALYIKAQLSDEPAWARAGMVEGDLAILQEKCDTDGNSSEDSLIQGMKDLDVSMGEEQLLAKMKSLAIERGDGNAPSRSFGLGEVNIKENSRSSQTMVTAPEPGMLHDSIKGYQPKLSGNQLRGSASAIDEDLIATI